MLEGLAAGLIEGFATLILYLFFAGKNNNGLFYLGFFFFLITLTIFIYASNQKIYTINDYSTQDIFVRNCYPDKQKDELIIVSDNNTYSVSRILLKRAGSEYNLAKSICAQKTLKIWLNPDNEVSGIAGEQIFIPAEAGIAEDMSQYRTLLLFPPALFGLPGFLLMALAILYNRLGIKINMDGRINKIHKHKINIRDGRIR